MHGGMKYIAHVRQDENGNWLPPHCLEEHLMSTAALASGFAMKFGCEMWENWLVCPTMPAKEGCLATVSEAEKRLF